MTHWIPRRAKSVVYVFALVSAIATAGCGYRPASNTLPGGVRAVRLVQPSPGQTGEPALSHLMVAELSRALSRQGIRVSSSAGAGAALETRLLDLQLTHTVISPARSRVSARGARLRVEFRLRDGQDRTLWRSGLVESERTWPLDASRSAVSEASRQATLQHLAADAARQCVDLMMSGL